MPKSNISFPSSVSGNNRFSRYSDSDLSGLFLSGQVIDRTRRTIQTRNNSTAQIVTYTIQDNNSRRYYVDEFAPDEYYEIGDLITVPVYVKTFKKNNGDIGYSFSVQQQLNLTRVVQAAPVMYACQELRPPAVNISDFYF